MEYHFLQILVQRLLISQQFNSNMYFCFSKLKYMIWVLLMWSITFLKSVSKNFGRIISVPNQLVIRRLVTTSDCIIFDVSAWQCAYMTFHLFNIGFFSKSKSYVSLPKHVWIWVLSIKTVSQNFIKFAHVANKGFKLRLHLKLQDFCQIELSL